MKKTLFFVLFTFLTIGSFAQGFTIKGEIKGAGNCKVVFTRITMDNNMFQDTVTVKNGKFTYSGKVEFPTIYTAMLNECKVLGDRYYTFAFYVENSKINVTGEIESSKSISIKGSAANDESIAIKKTIESEAANYRKLRVASSEAFKANDKVKEEEIGKEMTEVLKTIKKKLLALPNYSTSLIAPKYINDYFSASSTPEFMDEITAAFDPSIHSNPLVKELIEDNQREKRVKDGMIAHNFELQDLKGNTHRLSDHRGKYVLLEFSASWCGWCKLEVPFLKEVYEITKGKDDFVMFTVNLDTKRELWEEEANVPWKTIGDLKGTRDGVARAYNIHGVPMIYLISPDGKIISRTLRREALVQYFKEKYQKGVQFEPLAFDQAKAKAKESGKLLFLDCYTSWCGPCKKMNETVFNQEAVGAYFNAEFVNIKIDMEKGEGPELAKKYKVTAYPTFLVIDVDGKEVARVMGAHKMDDFMALVKDGVENPISIMHDRYEKGERSKEFLVKYIQSLAASYNYTKKNAVLDQFCKLYIQDLNKEEWVIFHKFLSSYDTYTFDYLLKNRKSVNAKFGKESVDKKIADILSPSVFNMLNSTLAGDIEHNEENYKKLRGAVARCNAEEKEYFNANLKFLNHFVTGKISQCVAMFESYYASLDNEKRFSATLHMNLAVIKKGTKKDCENALRVIEAEMKRQNITTEDQLFCSIVNGLKKKIESI